MSILGSEGIRHVPDKGAPSHRIDELLTTWITAAIDRFRKARHQRELAALSDRQLRDAGIDLALAGRGKAAAVSAATLRRLQSLS